MLDLKRKADKAPLRHARLAPAEADIERRPDGTLILRGRPLGEYHGKISEALEPWARETPDRIFLAQRDAGDRWRELSYAATLEKVNRIAAALLRRGLSAERPIAILSGNDIEQALLGLAAMTVGIPYAPISPAYSLMSSDFGKLRGILRQGALRDGAG
jgi:feruloyl-CoA synthase